MTGGSARRRAMAARAISGRIPKCALRIWLLSLSLALPMAQAAGRIAMHRQLSLGKPVTNKVAAGVSHAYGLSLTEGQFLGLAYYQPGFPSILRVVPVEGGDAVIERKMPGAAGQPEPVYWIAARTGKFRVEVASDEPGKPGAFKLELREWRPATRQDQSRVAGQREFEQAAALDDRHDYHGAFEALERALLLFQQAGDRERETASLLNMGTECDRQDRFSDGIGYFDKAIAISRELHNASIEGEALAYAGGDYGALNQFDKQIARLDQANVALKSARDLWGEVLVLTGYGNANYGLHDYNKAISYYSRALNLARSLSAHHAEADLLTRIGFARLGQDDYMEAVHYFETGRLLAHQRQDDAAEAAALNGLGYAYNNLDRYAEAIRYYDQALPIFQKLGDRLDEGLVINRFGLAYANMGDFERGNPYFEQALKVFREIQLPYYEGVVLHNLGWSYLNLKQLDKSRSYYDAALAIARDMRDRAREGRILMDTVGTIPDFERALALLREAGDRQAEAWTLRLLAQEYGKQGQFERAVLAAGQSVEVAHETKDPGSEARSLGVIMNLYKDQRIPRLAIFYGKRAVNLVQELRASNQALPHELQQSLVKSNDEMYHMLADLLIGAGRLGEAEQVLGLLKDEEYFNFLRRESGDSDVRTRKAGLTAEEEAYNRRFTEIQDRLVAIGVERGNLMAKASLDAAEQRHLLVLDEDIAASNAVFTKFLDELKTHFDAGPAGVRVQEFGAARGIMEDLRELPAGTVAIYTLVAEDKFRAILVTPDVEKSYEYAISSADLNRKVAEFRQVLQSPQLDPRPLGRELYAILIGKMADDLKQAHARTLMLSLDGTLRYLPMAALYDGEQYLIEKYAVTEFTPVSNSRLKDRPDRDWRAAGFGVTKAYDGEPALPSVAAELTGIIARRRGDGGLLQGEIKLDDDFTQQAMRTTLQKRFQVVHIASHFSFQPGNETASFLLLGDGTHLSLATFKNMSSLFGGVQLLTLSACNTGMGSGGGNGQEIEGFGRLAQAQGAKAVVASLWSVMDASTSLLMQTFYRLRQSTPGMSKAEALRQAQLMLFHGTVKGHAGEARGMTVEGPEGVKFQADSAAPYAHPYYWGAFFLMGNWL